MTYKILPADELKQQIDALRRQGNRIVFTNGCFDLLHLGHVTCLAEAKSLGDILVVALNSDASVKAIKGPQRPIVPERERVAVVAALQAVDFVTVFEEETPESLIRLLKPDILVKGGDWAETDVAGRDAVRQVVIIPSVAGVSTTDIIDRIEESIHGKR